MPTTPATKHVRPGMRARRTAVVRRSRLLIAHTRRARSGVRRPIALNLRRRFRRPIHLLCFQGAWRLPVRGPRSRQRQRSAQQSGDLFRIRPPAIILAGVRWARGSSMMLRSTGSWGGLDGDANAVSGATRFRPARAAAFETVETAVAVPGHLCLRAMLAERMPQPDQVRAFNSGSIASTTLPNFVAGGPLATGNAHTTHPCVCRYTFHLVFVPTVACESCVRISFRSECST